MIKIKYFLAQGLFYTKNQSDSGFEFKCKNIGLFVENLLDLNECSGFKFSTQIYELIITKSIH
jgi:hypothetical protein